MIFVILVTAALP